MARHVHEFQCTNCTWFNYPMLSEAMSGNYTIKCGHCNHEHYRVIKDGVVTEDRHSASMKNGDTIHVMPSASSEKQRVRGQIVQFREMAAAGQLT